MEDNPVIGSDPEVRINGEKIAEIYAEAKTKEIAYDINSSKQILDPMEVDVHWVINISN